MPYLIPQDYVMQIDPLLRAQINALAMSTAESVAMERINGYISKKYDTTAEFTSTLHYNSSTIYKAANRVYVNYPAYVAANSYLPGDKVTYGVFAYVCAANATGTFDTSKWSMISGATTLYYAAYPQQLFNVYGAYNVGDKVFYKDHIYTCKIASAGLSDFQQLQYGDYSQVPLSNTFPDDPINGSKSWQDNGAYTVPANSLSAAAYDTNTAYGIGETVTYTDNNVYVCLINFTAPAGAFDPAKWQLIWQLGDNRSQEMVTNMVSIALYLAHRSIAPNNIPEIREIAYNQAMEWCESVRKGNVSTPLIPIQPIQATGTRILADSEVKRGNSYR